MIFFICAILGIPLLAFIICYIKAVIESKKEGSAIFSSSLLRNGDELVLIQKPHIWAKRYFSNLKEAREAVPAFEEALASKEEGAVDAAIASYWTGFSILKATKEIHLLSMDDVAYFSISEQTTTTQTQTSSVDHTKMPGKLGTMTTRRSSAAPTRLRRQCRKPTPPPAPKRRSERTRRERRRSISIPPAAGSPCNSPAMT